MTASQAVATVQLDNGTVRVTEWRFAPGASTGYHRHEYPYVVVPMTTGQLAVTGPDGELARGQDRKSTRLNSSHTVIYTLSLHDALPIWRQHRISPSRVSLCGGAHDHGPARRHGSRRRAGPWSRSEEHTSELQSHRDLHSFPTRRSSDLAPAPDITVTSIPMWWCP